MRPGGGRGAGRVSDTLILCQIGRLTPPGSRLVRALHTGRITAHCTHTEHRPGGGGGGEGQARLLMALVGIKLVSSKCNLHVLACVIVIPSSQGRFYIARQLNVV